jgi:hypothetical protein
MARESERLERLLENVKDFAASRSDARAVDQLARKHNGIDGNGHAAA